MVKNWKKFNYMIKLLRNVLCSNINKMIKLCLVNNNYYKVYENMNIFIICNELWKSFGVELVKD